MTNEAYEKIISKISSMSDEDYQNLLSQAKEMDNDFQSMFESLAYDITESDEHSSSKFQPVNEQILSKVQDIECNPIPSQTKKYVQTTCANSEKCDCFGDFECLAA